MAKKTPITVDHLWQFERLGAPSLAPDGAQAVCSLTRFSMPDNTSSSALWLLSTLGGRARAGGLAFLPHPRQQGVHLIGGGGIGRHFRQQTGQPFNGEHIPVARVTELVGQRLPLVRPMRGKAPGQRGAKDAQSGAQPAQGHPRLVEQNTTLGLFGRNVTRAEVCFDYLLHSTVSAGSETQEVRTTKGAKKGEAPESDDKKTGGGGVLRDRGFAPGPGRRNTLRPNCFLGGDIRGHIPQAAQLEKRTSNVANADF